MNVRTSTLDDVTAVSRWARTALLALLGWWTLQMGTGASDWCFLDLVNLAFHEAGHLAFIAFGKTLHYLGGTLGQLIVPGGLVAWFLVRERRPFAAAVCAWWTGESLINVAVYMADARDLQIPLVGGGDHDWNELFFRFGLLGETSVRGVSAATHGLGVGLMLLGLAWGIFFVLPHDVQGRLRGRLTLHRPWLHRFLD